MNEQSSFFPSLPESISVASQAPTPAAAPRVLMAQRNQIALRPVDLEATVGPEHAVRDVWAFVERLDLSALYAEIGSVDGEAGRPAIDPQILMALWLYATVDAVGSAREIERLTEAHDAYRWICGGVNVNHHTLSDFRCARVDLLDELLTDSVAVLVNKGLVKLDRVAQDGMRVRASAGARPASEQPRSAKSAWPKRWSNWLKSRSKRIKRRWQKKRTRPRNNTKSAASLEHRALMQRRG